MGIPSNSVATTVNPVTPDQLNTYVQMCDTVDDLRQFIGVANQTVSLLGTASPGDGGQGTFYWNSTGTSPDDNGATTVIPSGSSVGNGEWTRVALGAVTGPGTSVVNDIATFSNTTGTAIKDSGISLGSQAEAIFLATPTGASGVPSFRVMAATDLPAILTPTNITGTTTNNNASVGSFGEYVAAGAADNSVAMTTAVPITVKSISLTAGDWDVEGSVIFSPGSGTTPTQALGCLSTVTNSIAVPSSQTFDLNLTFAEVFNIIQSTPTVRFSLAAPTTVYLVAQSTFTGGTLNAGGTVRARRMR